MTGWAFCTGLWPLAPSPLCPVQWRVSHTKLSELWPRSPDSGPTALWCTVGSAPACGGNPREWVFKGQEEYSGLWGQEILRPPGPGAHGSGSSVCPDQSHPVGRGTAGGGPSRQSQVKPKVFRHESKTSRKSHLKSCSLWSYPQTLWRLGEKKKKKSISYLNLSTSESLSSTFLLVLQDKIISPLALKGKLDQSYEKPEMMYFINFKLVPRLSPTLC